LTAQKFYAKGKKASVLKPYLSAIGRFVAMYLLKRGFLDGKMGFKIAQISALSNIVKYKTLRQLHRDGKS
jgi:(heptosyl)LPS beta-1,4-glucosyltransferase